MANWGLISIDNITMSATGGWNFATMDINQFAMVGNDGGYGNCIISSITLTSNGTFALVGNGNLNLDYCTVTGVGSQGGKGEVVFDETFTLEATGYENEYGNGSVDINSLDLFAVGTVGAKGTVEINGLLLNAVGYTGVIGDGDFQISGLSLAASGNNPTAGNALAEINSITLLASGYIIPKSVSSDLEINGFSMFGTGINIGRFAREGNGLYLNDDSLYILKYRRE